MLIEFKNAVVGEGSTDYDIVAPSISIRYGDEARIIESKSERLRITGLSDMRSQDVGRGLYLIGPKLGWYGIDKVVDEQTVDVYSHQVLPISSQTCSWQESWEGCYLRFMTGRLVGQYRMIRGHGINGQYSEGCLTTFSVSDVFTDAPEAGDTFQVERYKQRTIHGYTVIETPQGRSVQIEPGYWVPLV